MAKGAATYAKARTQDVQCVIMHMKCLVNLVHGIMGCPCFMRLLYAVSSWERAHASCEVLNPRSIQAAE